MKLGPWLAVVALVCTGCEVDDVGSECVGMEVPFPSGATFEGDVARAQSPEVVEFNVDFPCADPVCVITLGHPPYCSRECNRDSQCPDGFACEEVLNVGPFEGYKFCVWRLCDRAADCGDPWELGCETVPELSLEGDDTKLCRFR